MNEFSIYFVFCVCEMYTIAAPDLLKSATIPTAWVLLAEIVPGFIAQAVGPWFQEKIPYGIRFVEREIFFVLKN